VPQEAVATLNADFSRSRRHGGAVGVTEGSFHARNGHRHGSQTPDAPCSSATAAAFTATGRHRSRSSAGPSSGATTPDRPSSRAPSGSRTPTGVRSSDRWRPGPLAGFAIGCAGNHGGNRESAEDAGGSGLPLSRAGWSGTLDSDEAPPPTTPSLPTAPSGAGGRRPRPHVGRALTPTGPMASAASTPPDSPTVTVAPRKPERRKNSGAGITGGEASGGGGDGDAMFSSPAAKEERSPVKPFEVAQPTPVAAPVPTVTTTMSSASGDFCGVVPETTSPTNSSQASMGSSAGGSKHLPKPRLHMRHPRQSLRNGSRDDSFLSTISESTRSSDSASTEERQHRDSKLTVLDGSQIEVFSEFQGDGRMHMDVVKDFQQLFTREGTKYAEQMQQLLRQYGFDKPLEMQRRVIPLVMSAFSDEQKSFITVQGGPQCGKTSALVIGILGAIGAEAPGIRAVALSTKGARDFKRYFDICSELHPLRLECFECTQRKVSFEGLPLDPDSAVAGFNPLEDLQRISQVQGTGAPVMVFGHPSRVLPLLREAPSWGVDLSTVQVLVLDDAEETICMGLMDEVCEVCTILRHFSKTRLRHILLSHFLSHEGKSMIRCLRNSLLRQQNLFGIRAHKTQARAKSARHYYAVAPRARWPGMLAVLHHALALPSGIIFDDASQEARAQARASLRALGVTASVWNALQEQGSGARAAARDAAASGRRGPAFHLMPSDLVVLKVDLPQVRCVLHFEVPRRELSVYGLRLMCLEQQDQKKVSSRKAAGTQPDGRGLSVLFVEEEDVVRDLEKTFHIKMQEVPTEMLRAG